MEYWEEIFSDKIKKDNYEIKLINGERNGLIIEFYGKTMKFRICFGIVIGIRMLDEGIVQNETYSSYEIQKYKKDNFKNVIYKVTGGNFRKEITDMAGGYLDDFNVKHFVIISLNYNIDIISLFDPEIEIT